VNEQPALRSLPKNYELIHEIVARSGRGKHLTMGEIYAEASRLRPGIGYSTVYRGLVRLRELKLVAEIVVPGIDAATYEPIGPEHAHFYCTRCGALEDVEYALPLRTLKSVAHTSGLEIESGVVTFQGRCARCRPSQD
jgi:Fur family peroxide stress response transcriptional regulator